MKAAEELDRMLAGETVEASEDVRELAALAALLQGAWRDGPTSASATRVRTAALAAFQETADAAAVPTIVRSRPRGGRRLVARMALVAALVAGLPTAAWAATEDALPGQMLYSVKRGFEEVRLVLAGDAANEAEVLLGMVDERLGEAVRALGLDLPSAVDQALDGYDDALMRFQQRIVQARAEGLPVASLLEEAAGLAVIHDELFEDDPPNVVPPAEPTPGPSAPADKGGKGDGGPGKAKGKGGGKGNAKGHRGQGGNQGSGGGGGGNGASDGSGGDNGGGGNTGGGGGGNGGGGGEGGQEGPPAQVEEEDEGQETGSGHGTGDGEGLGHEIGKGKGHDKHGDDEG